MWPLAIDALHLVYWTSAVIVVGMILTGELTPDDGYRDPRELLWLAVFIFLPAINSLIAWHFLYARAKLWLARVLRS